MNEEKIRELMFAWHVDLWESRNDFCYECEHNKAHRLQHGERRCEQLESDVLCPEILRMASNVLFDYE